ncbi:MAG: hypothetical protein MRJ68_02410 [Nitrospira sp.]|nr:hypothetical protein [Nitrospira sp.]
MPKLGSMMDTHSQQVGYAVPGVAVTGKPLALGGSLGREEATGRGVVHVTLEALRHLKLSLEHTTVAIQGFECRLSHRSHHAPAAHACDRRERCAWRNLQRERIRHSASSPP